MGAGTARLSRMLQRVVPEPVRPTLRHVLVDRSTFKHKSDGKMRDCGAVVERLRCDIRHLDLGAVPCVAATAGGGGGGESSAGGGGDDDGGVVIPRGDVVILSKHLCGVATCYSLRCFARLEQEPGSGGHKVCVALCCHHLCRYEDYVGRDWIGGLLEIGRREFDMVRKATSWATCGWGGGKENAAARACVAAQPPVSKAGEAGEAGEAGAVYAEESTPLVQLSTSLSADEKQSIGDACKMIIDVGRVLYLRKQGFADARLTRYCPKETTLENRLLLASRGVSVVAAPVEEAVLLRNVNRG